MTCITDSYIEALRTIAQVRGARLKFVKVKREWLYPFAAEIVVGQRRKVTSREHAEQMIKAVVSDFVDDRALFMGIPIKVVP